jgi:RNA polymerase sigma factor (sigma-70 family)
MAPPRRSRDFDTTRWSVVTAVRSDDEAVARGGFGTLYEIYWNHAYTRLCSWLHDPEEAQDVAQAYFVRLIESGDLKKVRPDRGQFRSFFVKSLENFYNNYIRDRERLKRGGGQIIVPLEEVMAGADGLPELLDTETPESLFGRGQGNRFVNRAIREVKREWVAAGEGAIFECLESCLKGQWSGATYREKAAALGITEDAVKQQVRRMRVQVRHRLERRVTRVRTKTGIAASLHDLANAFRR